MIIKKFKKNQLYLNYIRRKRKLKWGIGYAISLDINSQNSRVGSALYPKDSSNCGVYITECHKNQLNESTASGFPGI